MSRATRATTATTGHTRSLKLALVVVVASWASTARAQTPAPPAPPVEAAPPPAEAAPPPVEAAPPPAEVAPPPSPPPPAEVAPPPPPRAAPPRVRHRATPPEASDEGETDLDPDTRPVGIGYAGVSQIPIGGATGSVTAPAIGARIWATKDVGVDVALGLGWAGGSTEAGRTTTDNNAVWGFILQAGVPVALSTHRHVAFELIPNVAFGYAHTKVPSNVPFVPSTTLSGTRFDLGARAGLEIFWGFIGLPQLSLSATVGLAFEMTTSTSDAGGGNKMSVTSYGIATTVQNNPWDIFTSNVAARYYF
jgi:hypothetical protein